MGRSAVLLGAMGRSAVLLGVVGAILSVNAEQQRGDDLFSFTGLDSLSDPDCVPQWYRLPARFTLIADQCVGLVDEEAEQATGDDPEDEARSSERRFQQSMRDCMQEKLGVVDDNGDLIEERLSEEITALRFPEAFERDVQSASRACLRRTPSGLTAQQRQGFYYVCRDSLLQASCLYKRMEREDPDRALDIGVKQTKCLEGLKPTPKLVEAMDECRDEHSVPIQYATLRRRRRSPASLEEGSGEGPEENDLSLADRVNLFIYCVFETVGALRPDGVFDAAPLIEELKQFEGDAKVVQLQVDSAERCRDKATVEEFNMCYYEDVSSGCHIFKVQEAFLAADRSLLPKY